MPTPSAGYEAPPEARAYILSQLQRHDHENYISNLLQRNEQTRVAHAAIRALNLELAQIRGVVTNEDLGRLRIAHFRAILDDALCATPSPSTPLAHCLVASITAFPHIDFAALHSLITAREADLAYPAYSSLSRLQAFARHTQGVLIAMHARLLGDDAHVVEAADVAGTAVGLAIVLRGVPAHAASRLSYMPADLVRAAHVPSAELFSGGERASRVFHTVATCADDHVQNAHHLVATLHPAVKPAFWPLRMAHMYLTRLKAAQCDPFDHRLARGLRTTYPLALQFRLLACRLLRR